MRGQETGTRGGRCGDNVWVAVAIALRAGSSRASVLVPSALRSLTCYGVHDRVVNTIYTHATQIRTVAHIHTVTHTHARTHACTHTLIHTHTEPHMRTHTHTLPYTHCDPQTHTVTHALAHTHHTL